MTSSISGPADLTGHTALVTGAAGGQGRAICGALAREGADIVATDIDDSGLAAVEEIVTGHDQTCLTHRCDVSDPEEVDALMSTALETHDSLEILVTAHGVLNEIDISDMSLKEWNDGLNVNLTGNFLVTKACYDHMKENEYGKIVEIGSIAGISGGLVAGPNYSAAKAGIHNFVKWLAKHGAEHDIHANAIAPGPIDTALTDDVELTNYPPIARWGEPEDIAESVVFLGSQASNFITGQVLVVDGGILL